MGLYGEKKQQQTNKQREHDREKEGRKEHLIFRSLFFANPFTHLSTYPDLSSRYHFKQQQQSRHPYHFQASQYIVRLASPVTSQNRRCTEIALAPISLAPRYGRRSDICFCLLYFLSYLFVLHFFFSSLTIFSLAFSFLLFISCYLQFLLFFFLVSANLGFFFFFRFKCFPPAFHF